MNKTCFKCGESKSVDEFYKHPGSADGYLGKCKGCTKKDTTANRENKAEYYKRYDKKRAQLPHRVRAREKYQKENLEKVNEIKKKWAKKNRHKTNATLQVKRAIEKGALVRSEYCDNCKNTAYTEGHHHDYNKLLEVIWLCKKCHTDVHWNGLEVKYKPEYKE